MKRACTYDEKERGYILDNSIDQNCIEYWCKISHVKYDETESKSVIQYDLEEVDETTNEILSKHHITRETVQKGIDLILSDGFEIAERIIAQILNDDNDIESTDCIIQAAIFGELKYG